MVNQALLIRRIRAFVNNIPGRWPSLWENQSDPDIKPPYMTIQVSIAGAQFAALGYQERIQGIVNLGFVVKAGLVNNAAVAEKEAARIAGFLYDLPGVRLMQPPQIIDGYRDGERWRVGLVVRWEQLP